MFLYLHIYLAASQNSATVPATWEGDVKYPRRDVKCKNFIIFQALGGQILSLLVSFLVPGGA